MNPLYETMATSVFERMSLAATKHGAVNLGQGFPDFGWPEEILDYAAQALKQGSNQYAPSRGLPAYDGVIHRCRMGERITTGKLSRGQA